MPIEAQTLLSKRFQVGETIALSDEVLLHVSGVGAQFAEKGAERLLEYGAESLVSWGLAGGIAPGITSGHLIMPEYIFNEEMTFQVDPRWINQIKPWLPKEIVVMAGSLYQSDKILTEVAEKKALFAKHKATAVDMESVAVAKVASQANLPFMALRAIVDSSDQALPHWFKHSLTAEGALRPWQLALNLSRYPNTLRYLLQLAKGFNLAQQTLKMTGANLSWTKQPILEPA